MRSKVLARTLIEAVAQRCSVKRVFLQISQNSQENTCATVSFLIKLQAWAYNFIKKETGTGWRRFGVFIADFEHISHLVLVFLLLSLSR